MIYNIVTKRKPAKTWETLEQFKTEKEANARFLDLMKTEKKPCSLVKTGATSKAFGKMALFDNYIIKAFPTFFGKIHKPGKCANETKGGK